MARQKKISIGKCAVCGKKLDNSEIKKHLSNECFFAKNQSAKGKLYYLEVKDAYAPAYWLLFAVSENATLEDINGFLRDIWLECCGHLSSFNIDGETYDSCPDPDFDMDGKSMKCKIKGIFAKGMEFDYTYDFGSSTELVFKVIDIKPGKLDKKVKVQLLAANLFPENQCDSCKKTAMYACPCCGEKVCEACADEHECGGPDDILLPLTNSPRCGVCAYTGGSVLDSFQ